MHNRRAYRVRCVAGGTVTALLAVGGLTATSGAAAVAAPASPAAVVTPLSLINGWVSEDSVYGTGNPSVTKIGGVVHLGGSLANGTSGSAAFVLPVQDRPSKYLYMDTYTFADSSGYIVVEPNGYVYIEGAAATSYTSLAGIKFPAATSGLAFSTLSLINGWTSEDSVFSTGDPAVAKDSGGVVHLAGSTANGQEAATAFVLPPGERPAHDIYLNTYTFGGTVGIAFVGASGSVILYGPDVTSYTSLAGITFYAAGATPPKNLTLLHGWKGGSYATGAATAAKDGAGIVHLAGGLNNNTGGGTNAFVLPVGDRPSHTLFLTTYTFGGAIGDLVIYANGAVYPGGQSTGSTTTAAEFTSLGSITFQAGV